MQEDDKAKRLRELRTMPYREYLLSPEWQERRKSQLARSGYRCQVCNAGKVQLEVHHRTYERRGNEAPGDLITLCLLCHDLFHRAGRLAKEDRLWQVVQDPQKSRLPSIRKEVNFTCVICHKEATALCYVPPLICEECDARTNRPRRIYTLNTSDWNRKL